MSTKKVVIACASFKGTLTSRQAGEALARGLNAAGFNARVVALADGGEGLVEALGAQVHGARRCQAPCRDPLGRPRSATFALLPAQLGNSRATAVIEMAASSGLPLVPENLRNPRGTTTLGVGDQILAALREGGGDVERVQVLLGIGGSATNDGGAGMAQALGARLLDSAGRDLPPGGAALIGLDRIDVKGLHPGLSRLPVTVACDVRNPLCGPQGASRIFGPQKGASAADAETLDAALAHYAEIVRRDLGRNVKDVPGTGAAGGLGAGCLAFLNATLKPGIELVLDALGFERMLDGAALVITGEGCLDEQTLMGKAPAGVAAGAARAKIRCIAVGGGIDETHRAALQKVFTQIESLSTFAGSADEAKRNGACWLERLAAAKAAEWLTG